MLIHCNSKRCNTTREHKLKVDSNEAICLDCGESNNMISDFMKNVMKGNGDILRSSGSRKAFTYKCPKCVVDRGVRIVDEQAVCDVCLHPLDLTAPMIEAIKMSSKTKEDESTENVNAPKEEVNKGVVRRRK